MDAKLLCISREPGWPPLPPAWHVQRAASLSDAAHLLRAASYRVALVQFPLEQGAEAELRALERFLCQHWQPQWVALVEPAMLALAGWDALDAATLGQQRGGFTTASGLAVSFGIERMVSVNGVLLSRTSVSLADLGSIATHHAGETGATLSALNLLQNGSGNMMAAALSGHALGATVIQNTLDNQTIDSRTVISASVNSAVLLSTVHFHTSLSEALARAAGP